MNKLETEIIEELENKIREDYKGTVAEPVIDSSIKWWTDYLKSALKQQRQQIREEIRQKRQKAWQYHHEAQMWKEQKEVAQIYDRMLKLPSLNTNDDE